MSLVQGLQDKLQVFYDANTADKPVVQHKTRHGFLVVGDGSGSSASGAGTGEQKEVLDSLAKSFSTAAREAGKEDWQDVYDGAKKAFVKVKDVTVGHVKDFAASHDVAELINTPEEPEQMPETMQPPVFDDAEAATQAEDVQGLDKEATTGINPQELADEVSTLFAKATTLQELVLVLATVFAHRVIQAPNMTNQQLTLPLVLSSKPLKLGSVRKQMAALRSQLPEADRMVLDEVFNGLGCPVLQQTEADKDCTRCWMALEEQQEACPLSLMLSE